MRYLVLIASFMVLALLELPALVAPPTTSAVSSQDVALASPCLGQIAEQTIDVGAVSPSLAPVDVAPTTLTTSCCASEVLRLLCFSEPSSREDNNLIAPTMHQGIEPVVRVIGDRRPPLTC